MGYNENTTMYEILFANDRAKSYKADQKMKFKLDMIIVKHLVIIEMF